MVELSLISSSHQDVAALSTIQLLLSPHKMHTLLLENDLLHSDVHREKEGLEETDFKRDMEGQHYNGIIAKNEQVQVDFRAIFK